MNQRRLRETFQPALGAAAVKEGQTALNEGGTSPGACAQAVRQAGRAEGEVSKPVALYRHFNAAGRLLYVGILIDPNRRIREHSYESDWFDDVTRVEIERYPTQAEAAKAEREAVKREKPEHNAIKFEGRKRPYLQRVRPMATGDKRPSWQVQREIVDRLTTGTPVKWWTVEGCANRVLMNPERLRPCIVFPPDRKKLKGSDVISIADMVIRGVLRPDNPWIVGSPIPDHMDARGQAA